MLAASIFTSTNNPRNHGFKDFVITEPHGSAALQTQTLDRKKVISMKCLATVHSPVRGRARNTIQRPRGAAIEQLIAEECGELALNRSQDDLDDSEDPDEG